MGLFDFGKSKSTAKEADISAKLDKDIDRVLNDLRQTRVDKCQNMGLSITQIGKDLAYIERKTREFYSSAVQDIKSGQTQSQAFQNLMANVTTDADREIVSRMFITK